MIRPRLALAALVIAAPMLLSGCAGSQSKDAACDTLEAGLVDTVTELQTQAAELRTDPEAASKAIDELTEAFDETVGSVSAGDIKPLAETARDKLDAFATAVSDAAADPDSVDQTAFSTSTTELQTALQDLATACQ